MATIIITDSTTDLPRGYIDAHACLDVIPMVFQFGTEEHLDRAGEVDNHANYERLRAGDVATTSQLNSDFLYNRFKKYLQNGDDVLYLAFSSGLSGTCSNGILAANDLREELPDRKVIVVDSVMAALGEGLFVAITVDHFEKTNADVETLAKWAEDIKFRVNAWFTVDDLKFLKRGGRVSAAAAAFGTMLSIKPVLHIDNEGHLIPMEKARGRKRSIKALLEHMEERSADVKNFPVFIGHGDCLDEANQLADMIEERFGTRPAIVDYIGMVIGAHSGPGTVALFFVGDNRG